MAKLNINQSGLVNQCKNFSKNNFNYSIFKSLPFVIFRNWLFQGTALMHWSELLFRAFLEMVLFLLLYYAIVQSLSSLVAFFLSLIICHTLMWTINGHFWALHIGPKKRLVINTPKRIKRYLYSLDRRVLRYSSMNSCIIFGSLARGSFHKYSDLDIVFSPKCGFKNHLLTYAITTVERSIAFIKQIPVEIYNYPATSFVCEDETEIPIVVKDVSGEWERSFLSATKFSDINFDHQDFFKEI